MIKGGAVEGYIDQVKGLVVFTNGQGGEVSWGGERRRESF